MATYRIPKRAVEPEETEEEERRRRALAIERKRFGLNLGPGRLPCQIAAAVIPEAGHLGRGPRSLASKARRKERAWQRGYERVSKEEAAKQQEARRERNEQLFDLKAVAHKVENQLLETEIRRLEVKQCADELLEAKARQFDGYAIAQAALTREKQLAQEGEGQARCAPVSHMAHPKVRAKMAAVCASQAQASGQLAYVNSVLHGNPLHGESSSA